MANKRVIELNERTQIDMNDWLLVDSSTSTRKLSIATLLSYFTYYSLIFVEELPTQDIQPNVVYLVPHSGSNTQWDEYIYINNDWSLIGTATIDLESIYQTKTDNNLQTNSKQIVGAINEVNASLTQKQLVIENPSGVTADPLSVCNYIKGITSNAQSFKGVSFTVLANSLNWYSGNIWGDGGHTWWGIVIERNSNVATQKVYKYYADDDLSTSAVEEL